MRQNHHELCQRIAASFHWYVHFVRHPLARSSCRTIDLPLSDIPIEAFKTCIVDGPFSLQLAPQIIALVFGESFRATIVDCSVQKDGGQLVRLDPLFLYSRRRDRGQRVYRAFAYPRRGHRYR
jgi:hypothetical protein